MNGVKIGIGFGQWKYGLPEPELICRSAEQAEAVGLDSFWLSIYDSVATRSRPQPRAPSAEISCETLRGDDAIAVAFGRERGAR